MTRVQTNGLQVAPVLHDFIEREAIAGTGLSSAAFWEGLAGLVRDFAPRDRELLAVRDKIQGQIDEYHRGLAGKAFDQAKYEQFLRDIGYVLPEPEDFSVQHRSTWTTRSPASPVRSSWCRCRTPAMRSMPPMPAGAASTTRSTAPTPSPRRTAPAARAATTRRAAAKVVEHARAVLDEAAPLRGRQPRGRGLLRGRGRHARRHACETAPRPASAIRRASSAIRAMRRARPPCCCATTTCISTSGSTARTRSAPTIRPASPIW